MQINIFSIQKNTLEFKKNEERYIKFIGKYCSINDVSLHNKKVTTAQKINEKEAKKSYENLFDPYKKKGFCIILDQRGKALNSMEFSDLICDKSELSFFIGGAYGFDEEFINKFDFVLSLSSLTLAHQFAKILLLEQIYRSFCIRNNHPYHK